VRENPELFRNANEYFNMILKSTYLVSLSFQEKCLGWHIKHIKNIKGGRIDRLLPIKSKPLQNVSKYVLTNVMEFIPVWEGFGKFRQINRKCNECFLQLIQNKANYMDVLIQEYTKDQ
jgi:hypothetical protein